jgi:hypothetical protein
MADRWNIPFVNNALKHYLEDKEFSQYKTLINMVINDDSQPGAKYNLWTLMMNHGTNSIIGENLSKALKNVYCADKNIQEYVHNAVMYNPKLGYVSITSKSRRDMKLDYSLDIYIPCSSERADKIVETCKEVLTMMLVESKTVPYEKVDPEES